MSEKRNTMDIWNAMVEDVEEIVQHRVACISHVSGESRKIFRLVVTIKAGVRTHLLFYGENLADTWKQLTYRDDGLIDFLFTATNDLLSRHLKADSELDDIAKALAAIHCGHRSGVQNSVVERERLNQLPTDIKSVANLIRFNPWVLLLLAIDQNQALGNKIAVADEYRDIITTR